MIDTKEICEEWAWDKSMNMIYHECLDIPTNKWEWATRSSDGHWVCRRCGTIAPEVVEDACLLIKVQSWSTSSSPAWPIPYSPGGDVIV